MQLAPGLHRLGDGLVNSYLVEDGGAITIVDAGMAGQYGDLERELASMGRTKADVKAIVLTHGDTDHVGYAERLRVETGIPVYVHAADADRARGIVKKPSSGWGPMKPGPFLGFMAYGLRKGGLRTKPVTDLATIDGDTTLDLPGSPRVIPLPGHTPGSRRRPRAAGRGAVPGRRDDDPQRAHGRDSGRDSRRSRSIPAAALASLGRARRARGRVGAARPRGRLDGGVEAALREIRDAAAKAPLPPARG